MPSTLLKESLPTTVREAPQTKRKRDTAASSARLIGLVGGQHESVIEKDPTLIYCTFYKEFRPKRRLCDNCPLKEPL